MSRKYLRQKQLEKLSKARKRRERAKILLLRCLVSHPQFVLHGWHEEDVAQDLREMARREWERSARGLVPKSYWESLIDSFLIPKENDA